MIDKRFNIVCIVVGISFLLNIYTAEEKHSSLYVLKVYGSKKFQRGVCAQMVKADGRYWLGRNGCKIALRGKKHVISVKIPDPYDNPERGKLTISRDNRRDRFPFRIFSMNAGDYQESRWRDKTEIMKQESIKISIKGKDSIYVGNEVYSAPLSDDSIDDSIYDTENLLGDRDCQYMMQNSSYRQRNKPLPICTNFGDDCNNGVMLGFESQAGADESGKLSFSHVKDIAMEKEESYSVVSSWDGSNLGEGNGVCSVQKLDDFTIVVIKNNRVEAIDPNNTERILFTVLGWVRKVYLLDGNKIAVQYRNNSTCKIFNRSDLEEATQAEEYVNADPCLILKNVYEIIPLGGGKIAVRFFPNIKTYKIFALTDLESDSKVGPCAEFADILKIKALSPGRVAIQRFVQIDRSVNISWAVFVVKDLDYASRARSLFEVVCEEIDQLTENMFAIVRGTECVITSWGKKYPDCTADTFYKPVLRIKPLGFGKVAVLVGAEWRMFNRSELLDNREPFMLIKAKEISLMAGNKILVQWYEGGYSLIEVPKLAG